MLRNNQRGAISMLTVIFLALLLTVITTSFVRLSVTEQRQAVDDDLTTRAFYAAESGVEDAKRAISDFQEGLSVDLNETDCEPASVVLNDGELSSELDTEYTCQLIDMSPLRFQDDLNAWESITIPLNGADAFDSVLIEWHKPKDQDGDGNVDYFLRNNQKLLTVDTWNNGFGHPAMLRTATFSHSSPTFTSNEIQQSTNTKFLNPHNSGTASASTLSNDGEIVNVDCDPSNSASSGSYVCRVRLTNIDSSRTNYLRLQTLYTSTDIQVTLLDGNNPVVFEDVQAVVDVTGRAGDVFRRVEARISLLSDDFFLPDIALWSNTDICKAFTVTDDSDDYDITACPWQP